MSEWGGRVAYRDNTQLEGEVNVTKLPLFALGRGKQSRGERETEQGGKGNYAERGKITQWE